MSVQIARENHCSNTDIFILAQGLNIQDSTQMESIYGWLQSGWVLTKPPNEETDAGVINAVHTIMQQDCGDIYKLVYGNDGRQRSNSRFKLDDELRDILVMALDLDDMRMKSQAMISVVWVKDLPEFADTSSVEYRDSHMEVVYADGNHSENARVTLCVSPILLKRGNANGKNYDCEIVLVKADVMLD